MSIAPYTDAQCALCRISGNLLQHCTGEISFGCWFVGSFAGWVTELETLDGMGTAWFVVLSVLGAGHAQQLLGGTLPFKEEDVCNLQLICCMVCVALTEDVGRCDLCL